ncbi:hypothetical protein NC651_010949 [Populus alba x Populus x berolinensis]|nr:hypothetical protein NC651_010949 [Populus alba x Populus x berolinensis]
MAEELIGVARYAGLFSPAIMTTIFGSASRTGILVDRERVSQEQWDEVASLVDELDKDFAEEQARIINDTVIRPNMNATPTKT